MSNSFGEAVEIARQDFTPILSNPAFYSGKMENGGMNLGRCYFFYSDYSFRFPTNFVISDANREQLKKIFDTLFTKGWSRYLYQGSFNCLGRCGDFEFIEFVKSHFGLTHYTSDLIVQAIYEEHYDLAIKLIGVGYPVDDHVLSTASARNLKPIVELIIDHPNIEHREWCATCAARNGHLDMIHWYLSKGYQLPQNICDYAVCGEHRKVLDVLVGLGFKPSYDGIKLFLGNTFCQSRQRPNIDFFDHVADIIGQPPTTEKCDELAKEFIKCYWLDEDETNDADSVFLRWLLKQGLVLTPELCARAATRGNLRCLKLFRFFDCPWDETTLISAKQSCEGIVCYTWAIENGCRRSDTERLMPGAVCSCGLTSWH
jgi:hypothetical protein